MQDRLISRACELLASGDVARVLGWRKGEFVYDVSPDVFTSCEDIKDNFVFNDFCGPNLSKYLISLTRNDGKTLVFLKPCDSYSFNQLLDEHKFDREKVYVIGVSCSGMFDPSSLSLHGVDGLIGARRDGESHVVFDTLGGEISLDLSEALPERCLNCKSRKVVVYDEMIGENGIVLDSRRFDRVAELEAMTPDERFEFWRGELSRCIRCNACRNVCPACTCEKCVFDNPSSGMDNKAAADRFEEKLFHIIRAFHVAGRCTDCGECSRVCPEHIPLHLLNRKFIKDMNLLYGEYTAGETTGRIDPVSDFTLDDAEASAFVGKGGSR